MVKILIVRLGALGDILHALPAVTGIRAALPDATIGWVIEERWSELLTARGAKPNPEGTSEQKPIVNLIHTVNTKQWRRNFFRPAMAREIRLDLARIRHVQYDFALDFQGAIKSAVFASISGATVKAGFATPRESAARFFYTRKFSRSGDHVIEQNHAMAASALKECLGERELKLLAPRLPVDSAAEAWANAEIARLGIASFAIVNPGAGWGGKQWPVERFGEVAKALARHNLKTLVNAGPDEDTLAQAVTAASGGNAFAVNCSIGQLIALTRRARLMIAGDTGPLHIAASLNVPIVGLFGPTDPIRTGPFGTKSVVLRHEESKTTFSHHRKPDDGLLKITVDEVIAAARHLLGSSHA
jgi:heptosyltransferase I